MSTAANVQTLQLVLAQAERERDAALLTLQQATARAQAARAQATSLSQYQDEYQTRWQSTFRSGGTGIETLQAYQGFGARLTDAIDQQGQLAGVLEARLQAARAALAEKETRAASVRKLIERRLAEVQAQLQRQEQKATDEFAQRAHRLR